MTSNTRQIRSVVKLLRDMRDNAETALDSDSNDIEHDALYELTEDLETLIEFIASLTIEEDAHV